MHLLDCDWCATHTCTAGAGSLLLEFGMLSRLLGDPVYEAVARRAAKALWVARAKGTGLLGNVIDVETGEWIGTMSGVGAGLDSFYEYLLKVSLKIRNTPKGRRYECVKKVHVKCLHQNVTELIVCFFCSLTCSLVTKAT